MRTIHVVSHTHWDREWYQTFQQFRLRLVHMIDGLLELLERDPEFKYFMLDGQTIVLEDYLAMRPENEAILRAHIQSGRILIGPWHVLPDMFLVGPESHIRNLQEGERTCRRFGTRMKIGYMPDSFGHIGQVPQILNGFGIQTASLWRGVLDGPSEFWWQSPDGARVLMAYLREGYGNGADLPAESLPRFAELLDGKAQELAPHSASSNLLVMYGTDHMEPPVKTSEAIAYADEMLHGSHVIHSTLPQYVAALQLEIKERQVELPVVIGELRACKRMPLLPGVLSTRIWIKQRNQASETLLTRWAGPFSAWQELVTGPVSTSLNRKAELLHEAWRLLMQNHPHDSICGCSIDQVHEEMKVRFDQVDQIGEELTRQSLGALSAATDTRPARNDESLRAAIVVYNPTGRPRTDIVDATFELPPEVREFELVDESGARLPFQTRGLGNREVVNMRLDAKGFRSTIGNVNEGRAAGMTIQDIQVTRQGAEATIEAIMVEGGEPNRAAWERGIRTVDGLLADPSVTTYNVHVRSASANRLVFAAPQVPGLGWRTLHVRALTPQAAAPVHLNPLLTALLPLAQLPLVQKLAMRKRYARPPYRIENEFFRVEAGADGLLTVVDRRSNITYPGLNRFVDGGDCGDEYNYAPPAADRMVTARLKHVSLEHGPVQQSLTLELELRLPAGLTAERKARSAETVAVPVTSTVTLSGGVARLDIHTCVDNRTRDHRLRVHFPAPFAAEAGDHDGAFEVVRRPIGVPAYDATWVEQPRPEVPQRAFTDVSDGTTGLSIANRGLPEVEVLKNAAGNAEIALTLLRCVGWLSRDDFSTRNGHAGPAMETPGAQLPGRWTFDYAILPHAGGWQGAADLAYAFGAPLRAAVTGIHTGLLPASGAFAAVEPSEFTVSTACTSLDGKGWILRGYNLTGETQRVVVRSWRSFRHVRLVDLAEQPLSDLPVEADGTVRFEASGHRIVSLKFED